MWVQSLLQEDPLEEETATHSSIMAWEMPWTEEPGGATLHAKEPDTTELLSTSTLEKWETLPWFPQQILLLGHEPFSS